MNTFKINNRFNTMNLSKHSGDKELFYETNIKENTMNLSKHSGDKELFYGTNMKENTLEYDIENKYSLFEIDFLSKQIKNYRIIGELDNNEDIKILIFFYNIVLILFVIVALNTYFVIKN